MQGFKNFGCSDELECYVENPCATIDGSCKSLETPLKDGYGIVFGFCEGVQVYQNGCL